MCFVALTTCNHCVFSALSAHEDWHHRGYCAEKGLRVRGGRLRRLPDACLFFSLLAPCATGLNILLLCQTLLRGIACQTTREKAPPKKGIQRSVILHQTGWTFRTWTWTRLPGQCFASRVKGPHSCQPSFRVVQCWPVHPFRHMAIIVCGILRSFRAHYEGRRWC